MERREVQSDERSTGTVENWVEENNWYGIQELEIRDGNRVVFQKLKGSTGVPCSLFLRRTTPDAPSFSKVSGFWAVS